jgi:hypothetical protein
MNRECDRSEAVSARGVGRNAAAGGPVSRPFSTRKKPEQPWEYVRKGGTKGGTESVLFRLFTAFHGFLRLTGGEKFGTLGGTEPSPKAPYFRLFPAIYGYLRLFTVKFYTGANQLKI